MSSSLISSSSSSAAAHPFEGFFDVTCTVDVMVGAATITVRDCLRLRRNSVVQLRKPSGTDLDVSVHGVLVALGEVVIVEESTALRTTRIAQPPSVGPEL